MRIHETKHQVNVIPEKWEDISIDLDCIAAARRYDDRFTQIVTGFGLAYVIVDHYDNFSTIWKQGI